jgi:hypothetical protein
VGIAAVVEKFVIIVIAPDKFSNCCFFRSSGDGVIALVVMERGCVGLDVPVCSAFESRWRMCRAAGGPGRWWEVWCGYFVLMLLLATGSRGGGTLALPLEDSELFKN